MPNTNVLTETQYAKLLKDIRKLIEEGRSRATRAAGQELVQTYWEIGKRMVEAHLTENAGYDVTIVEDLADELNIDRSTLQRSIHFFQTYVRAPRGTELMWTHYRMLLPISDDNERKWYENLIEENGLTTIQLANAIKKDQYAETQKSKGKKLKSKKLKRPTTATYVYKATIERVIDGDTLLVNIDLGFQVFKQQRIRLAEIDTPPIDEDLGQKAFKFVRDQLAKAPFIIIKTNKIDIYGRYVGHVFYSLKKVSKVAMFEEGRFLNEELVEKGLAKVL